jgi:hypothetical protein
MHEFTDQMASLPSLVSLSLESTAQQKKPIQVRWYEACGRGESMPIYKQWNSLRADDKATLLHRIAEAADDDEDPTNSYLTPYELIDTDDVRLQRLWSVEHIVPRSHTHGAVAKNDPNGWIQATRKANSARGNMPLVLWRLVGEEKGSMDKPSNTVWREGGHAFYVPPLWQRARLARKWLYIRATYGADVKPMHPVQRAHLHEILTLVEEDGPSLVEIRVNNIIMYKTGWSNPLIDAEKAALFLNDSDWVDMLV